MTRAPLAELSDLTRALFAASAADDRDACERLVSARARTLVELAYTFSKRGPNAEERLLLDAIVVMAHLAESQLAARSGELGDALAQLRAAHVAVRARRAGARSTLGRA